MTAAGPCGPMGPAEPWEPGRPEAPVRPGGPAGPCGPVEPTGPPDPVPLVVTRVMSRSAGWLVRSFSLESIWRAAVPAERARPKLVEGLVIQPCTAFVTSMVTYWPAALIWVTAMLAPSEGAALAVTMYSPQVEVMGETERRPGVSARLTKRRRVARETWVAEAPAGRVERSNWRSAVEPEPTTRLERVPKLMAGWAVETWVSAVRVTMVARAGAVPARRASAKNRLTKVRWCRELGRKIDRRQRVRGCAPRCLRDIVSPLRSRRGMRVLKQSREWGWGVALPRRWEWGYDGSADYG